MAKEEPAPTGALDDVPSGASEELIAALLALGCS